MEADAAENDGGEEEEEEEADGDSSGETGSDSGEEGNGSSSDDEPSTPPPPIELPDRSTRGKRLRAVCRHPLTTATTCRFVAGFTARQHVQRPVNISRSHIR